MNMDLKEIVQAGAFDLHIHTTASDGEYSPTAIVKKAKEIGLRTIAITDHDTLDGIEEAVIAGKRHGINVIPAIELTTKYKGTNVDILGYNVKASEKLQAILVQLKKHREGRAMQIIEKFNDIGFTITLDEVKQFSEDGVIARPHIAKAIVKKGYVLDYQTVFDEYLADGKPCAIDKMILTPEEGIKLIHEAGGKAILAHPVYLEDTLVRELLALDFDGIEVWHRNHDETDQEKYKMLATEFALIKTGGSDFHTDEHSLGQFGWKADEE
ncbi:PHP domain-containing protein [Halalkalibacterium halodurans]|nr:PHP domain-containing protein [Halalkalibacterium halodurans]MED4172732.1 PHP domain-containing protein [Halalkalibacterium halodurans]